MEVQPLSPIDLSHIPALIPPGWDTALPAIEFYTKSDFCFPIKITVENTIIGTGTAIIHKDVAWLAHIIVHPDCRNQGIGHFITKKLVDIAKDKNCATIYLLATELGEPVYRKIGFEEEAEYLFFKRDAPIASVMRDDNIVPYSSDYLGPISILDLRVSGEDRMFHLATYLTSGWVYVQANVLLGYYLPALGDGLIIAATPEAGKALTKFRMTSRDFIVFPSANDTAATFVRQYPLSEVRRQKRMRLGKRRQWEPSMIYNRIGGNLG